MRASVVLFVLVCLFAVRNAEAQGEQGTGYEGVQLAPTVHGSGAWPHLRGGIGADLSVTRWFNLELWGSRVSRPNTNRDWYPGAWSTGIAVNSRIAWPTHAFVYGAGFVYTSVFYCPRSCSYLTAIALEETRAAYDMRAVQFRFGYEARTQERWFFRALTTFDLPFATSRVTYPGPGETYPYHEPAPTFMHVSLVLTLGYAFRLH